jgi:hypothetical protein
MEDLYNELQNFSLTKIIKIEDKTDNIITFKPIKAFHDNEYDETYEIMKHNDKVVITDNGITYSNLGNIFILDEPDVINNLELVMRESNIKWIGKEFIYEINLEEKLYPQILLYLQGINFLYTLRIFYI